METPKYFFDSLGSIREEAAPRKTITAYKLMRLIDGELYPLYIDRAAPVQLGVWYNADSHDCTAGEYYRPSADELNCDCVHSFIVLSESICCTSEFKSKFLNLVAGGVAQFAGQVFADSLLCHWKILLNFSQRSAFRFYSCVSHFRFVLSTACKYMADLRITQIYFTCCVNNFRGIFASD